MKLNLNREIKYTVRGSKTYCLAVSDRVIVYTLWTDVSFGYSAAFGFMGKMRLKKDAHISGLKVTSYEVK